MRRMKWGYDELGDYFTPDPAVPSPLAIKRNVVLDCPWCGEGPPYASRIATNYAPTIHEKCHDEMMTWLRRIPEPKRSRILKKLEDNYIDLVVPF